MAHNFQPVNIEKDENLQKISFAIDIMDTYKIIDSDEGNSEAEENIQTTKANPITAEKSVPNPVEQTKNTSTSKKETLPQEPGYLPKAILPNPLLGESIGSLVWILILLGIGCVVFGLTTAYQEVEIPRTSIWSSVNKVRTVPNMVIGLVWVGAGISQLLLALILVVWKAAKSFLELLRNSTLLLLKATESKKNFEK